MRAGERRRREELDREIAVGDGVERVRRGAVETERLGGHVAVDQKGRAGQRGGAERAFIEPSLAIGKAAAVTPDHLDIGQQMMTEGHRFGGLLMSDALNY